MKVAVPTRNTIVDSHFGHCEYYTIAEIDENKNIIDIQTIPSPQGCGCKSDIAVTLRDMGVSVMLAGNMGQGAIQKITHAGIEVIRGCSGSVDTAIQQFVDGKLSDSGLSCSAHEHHHEEGHQCNHS